MQRESSCTTKHCLLATTTKHCLLLLSSSTHVDVYCAASTICLLGGENEPQGLMARAFFGSIPFALSALTGSSQWLIELVHERYPQIAWGYLNPTQNSLGTDPDALLIDLVSTVKDVVCRSSKGTLTLITGVRGSGAESACQLSFQHSIALDWGAASQGL